MFFYAKITACSVNLHIIGTPKLQVFLFNAAQFVNMRLEFLPSTLKAQFCN